MKTQIQTEFPKITRCVKEPYLKGHKIVTRYSDGSHEQRFFNENGEIMEVMIFDHQITCTEWYVRKSLTDQKCTMVEKGRI